MYTRLLCHQDMKAHSMAGDSAQRFAIVGCFRPQHGGFRETARTTPNPPMAAPYSWPLYTVYRRATRCHRVGPIDYPAPGVGTPVRLPRGTIPGDYVKVYGLACRGRLSRCLPLVGGFLRGRAMAGLLAACGRLLPYARRGGVYGSRIRLKYVRCWLNIQPRDVDAAHKGPYYRGCGCVL